MPRIAESRPPAVPTSPDQRDRHRRIVRAAAHLGAENDFDHVQMQDIAKQAGVALGTLYRYFPSKSHLFAGVMRESISDLTASTRGPSPKEGPADSVATLLLRLTTLMTARPSLTMSMLQGNNALHAAGSSDGVVDESFEQLILVAAGWPEPTLDQRRRARLVMQCWYGVLVSTLNARSNKDEAEADIRRACQLLLA